MERDFVKEKLQEYLKGVNAKRNKVAQAHRARQSNSPFGEGGSIDVYALSMKMEGAVELAKKLGVIDKNKDPQELLNE